MKKKDNGKSTQELIGIKGFSGNGFQTVSRFSEKLVTGELVYFLVSPTNISVLSQTSVGQKVHHLMQLLSAQPDIEIICTDTNANKLAWRALTRTSCFCRLESRARAIVKLLNCLKPTENSLMIYKFKCQPRASSRLSFGFAMSPAVTPATFIRASQTLRERTDN